MKKYFTVCAAFILSACTSVAPYPMDAHEQGKWFITKSNEAASSGNHEKAVFNLSEAMTKPGGEKLVAEHENANKGRIQELSKFVINEAEIHNNKSAINEYGIFLTRIYRITQNKATLDRYSEIIVRRNNNNEIDWILSDDMSGVTALMDAKSQGVIFKRSLDRLREPDRDPRLLKSIVKYLNGASDYEKSYALNRLESYYLKMSEIRELGGLFPEWASKKLLSAQIDMSLHVSGDRLLEEDLKQLVRNRYENIRLLAHGDFWNAKTVRVEIEKLAYDERIRNESSRQVSYAQHEVDMMQAVLLMPRDSTYKFTIRTGGVDVSYGYILKVIVQGGNPEGGLIRGNMSESYAVCEDRRVINIFGGSEKAEFVANDNMRGICSGSSEVASPASIRNRIIEMLLKKMMEVPQLRNAA